MQLCRCVLIKWIGRSDHVHVVSYQPGSNGGLWRLQQRRGGGLSTPAALMHPHAAAGLFANCKLHTPVKWIAATLTPPTPPRQEPRPRTIGSSNGGAPPPLHPHPQPPRHQQRPRGARRRVPRRLPRRCLRPPGRPAVRLRRRAGRH